VFQINVVGLNDIFVLYYVPISYYNEPFLRKSIVSSFAVSDKVTVIID